MSRITGPGLTTKKDVSRTVAITKDGLILTTVTTQEIKHCTDCPCHEQHGLVTPDSFEHYTGVYCSLVSSNEDDCSYRSNTYDGHIDKKFCFSWEWASEIKDTVIPDWCPLRAEAKTE